MSDHLTYKRGLSWAYANWVSGTVKGVLATTGITLVDATGSEYLGDVITGYEYAATGYSRINLGSKTQTFGDFPARTMFDAADPDFGVCSGGDVAAKLLLVGWTGSDATSPIICAFSVGYIADGVKSALFPLPTRGALCVVHTCPAEL